MSIASVILKVGVASVAIPGIGFVIGTILSAVIPGCHCDEGVGCHGCAGFDGLIALLMMGGFVAALAAFITVLPVSVVLAGIFGIFSKSEPATLPEPKALSSAEFATALSSAIEQYRLGQPATKTCPACSSVISLVSAGSFASEATVRVISNCTCGGCSGTYDINRQV